MSLYRVKTIAAVALIGLLVNTAYIAAFSSPTILYMANVLGHVALGLLVAILGAATLARHRELRSALRIPAVLFAVALGVGGYLTVHGNLADDRWILRLHIAFGLFAVAALVPFALRTFAAGGAARSWAVAFAGAAALAVVLPLSTNLYTKRHPARWSRIANPATAPVSMAEEGGGPRSPFFPSSAKTNVGGIIPSNFFMDSETCGECHKE